MFEKFLKGLSEEGKKKLNEISEKASNVDIDLGKSATKEQERERTISEKYSAYDNASEDRKKRIENRDERRQKRYAKAKERTDAKRERYAEKMTTKGILGSKEEARIRFDNLRGITNASAKRTEQLMNLRNNNLPLAKEVQEEKNNNIEENSADIASQDEGQVDIKNKTVDFIDTGKNTTSGGFNFMRGGK